MKYENRKYKASQNITSSSEIIKFQLENIFNKYELRFNKMKAALLKKINELIFQLIKNQNRYLDIVHL